MPKLTQREQMAYSTIAKMEAEILKLKARIAELEAAA